MLGFTVCLHMVKVYDLPSLPNCILLDEFPFSPDFDMLLFGTYILGVFQTTQSVRSHDTRWP